MTSGRLGDETKLLISLAACLLGYGEVGLWLVAESKRENSRIKIEGNPYKRWIDDYAGPQYQNAVKAGLGMLYLCLTIVVQRELRGQRCRLARDFCET